MAVVVTLGAMVCALKRHEPMDRSNCVGVVAGDDYLTAAGQLDVRIPDPGTPFRHHIGARHIAIVDGTRGAEVAGLERCSDILQVAPDDGNTLRVIDIALQLDASTVREVVEQMGGRVLVHAHGPVPTGLKRGESSVRGGGPISRIIRLVDGAAARRRDDHEKDECFAHSSGNQGLRSASNRARIRFGAALRYPSTMSSASSDQSCAIGSATEIQPCWPMYGVRKNDRRPAR